jgi:hypothetical protein
VAFQCRKPAAIGVKAPFPGSSNRALASSIEKVPSGARWIHEIKFDGYRVQVHLANEAVKIFTRRGNDWTKRFRKVANHAWHIKAGSAIVDGEIVVPAVDGLDTGRWVEEIYLMALDKGDEFYNQVDGDRIASRQIDELIGIARGLVADDQINQDAPQLPSFEDRNGIDGPTANAADIGEQRRRQAYGRARHRRPGTLSRWRERFDSARERQRSKRPLKSFGFILLIDPPFGTSVLVGPPASAPRSRPAIPAAWILPSAAW